MLGILGDRTYRHLFVAQVVALMGTGLATVALGLLAYDIAGGNAALVLGTIFTIKMVAYVFISPLAGAWADRLPRRTLLIMLDVIRAVVALLLPFITEVWHVYVLIFALQSASAVFTPTFQATIPDVLPDEARYTRALSLSRLAYELENVISPVLAALLLMAVPYEFLFIGTFVGFIVSAALVISVTLPNPPVVERRSAYDRTTKGLRIFLATPRLRGLLALNLAAAAAGAMVLVNTVVLIRATLTLSDTAVALTLGCFGAGSMLAALALPALLERVNERRLMVAGAMLMAVTLLILAGWAVASNLTWPSLLIAWLFAGIGYSMALTPAGRLLRRSAHPGDRPALFAAQFSLSHVCWLITYPLAGWLMTTAGPVPTLLALGALSVVGIGISLTIWPVEDIEALEHHHDNLPLDHPHLQGERTHTHLLVIDEHHARWSARQ
ncbi:MAG: MFS transporter [Burkholderiaceae bacterium]